MWHVSCWFGLVFMFDLVLLVCSLVTVIILDGLLGLECLCIVWCYCSLVGGGCEWGF